MQGSRIVELDSLRGVAIFGVLVLHSSFEGRFTEDGMAVQAIMARVFDWAVLAFFFASGFLHDRSVPFVSTLRKKSTSLLVPFFLYNALYNLVFSTLGVLGWAHEEHVQIYSDLLANGFLHSPAFQLYFLPYLFVVSIGICALDLLTLRRHGLVHIILLVLVLAFYIVRGYPGFSHGPELIKLPLYLAAFLIGLSGRPLFVAPFARPWMIPGALCVVLGVLVVFRLQALSVLVPPLVVGTAVAVRSIRQSRLLLCLGSLSGSIYLWHTPVLLPAVTRFLVYCGIPSSLNLLGSIGLTLAACIVLRHGLDSFFVHVFKRQTPKWISL